MNRRLLLVAAFIATRLALGWLAAHPDDYHTKPTVHGDVTLYEDVAGRILDDGDRPYADVPLEYPPGVLPFVLAPGIEPAGDYLSAFVVLMVVVDALGLLAACRLSNGQARPAAAPWIWVAVIPLLGPVAYSRLDLVPVVLTMWALERLLHSRPLASGALWGAAVAAKAYPALFVPAAVLASRRRVAVLVGAVVTATIVLLPFATTPRPLVRSVVGYHTGREIEIESSAGLALLVARRLGADVSLEFSSGSFNVTGSGAGVLRVVTTVLTGAAWAASLLYLRRRRDPLVAAAVMLSGAAAALALSPVLSPQYLLWIAPPAIVIGTTRARFARAAVASLLIATAATQAIYPFLFGRLLVGHAPALVVLGLRNALLVMTALLACGVARDLRSNTTPAVPDPAVSPVAPVRRR